MPKILASVCFVLFEAGAFMILPNDPETGWLIVKFGAIVGFVAIWLWYRDSDFYKQLKKQPISSDKQRKEPNESAYNDMPLIELFDFLKNNVDYSGKFKELDGEDIAFKIAIDIKDNASQNRLDLYGRIYDKQFDQFLDPINQLEKIKLDDWNDFSFTMNFEDGEIQAENKNNTYNGNIYRDIQVERKQVISIWPEQVARSSSDKFISLSKAAQSLYSDLREFDKEHFHVKMADQFKDSVDGIINYFAIAISNRGEIYGKKPPSTKLEKIEQKEFNKGSFENNVSEFVRYSGKTVEFVELSVMLSALPEVLDSLKAENMVG